MSQLELIADCIRLLDKKDAEIEKLKNILRRYINLYIVDDHAVADPIAEIEKILIAELEFEPLVDLQHKDT